MAYALALAVVWGLQRGGLVSSAETGWLAPLVWVVAAVAATWPLAGGSRDLFTARQWLGSLRETTRWLLLAGGVLIPFSAAYLLYQGWWTGRAIVPSIPDHFTAWLWYQLIYVGFPEELFFRGYLQQRFDDALGRPHLFLGARWGWGLVLAAGLFALGHWMVTGDVRRVSVFVPGLLFGWLLARTEALAAPVIAHAVCNSVLLLLQAWVR